MIHIKNILKFSAQSSNIPITNWIINSINGNENLLPRQICLGLYSNEIGFVSKLFHSLNGHSASDKSQSKI